MQIRLRIHFFLLLISFSGQSQLRPVYFFQEDDSLRKKQYYEEALQKKKSLIAALPKENSKDYKEAYESMFEMVEDLLRSRRSVTAIDADNYIKAVAGKIIQSNPELSGLDLRIIFSRDFVPNAYSIGDGTIAFNAGLFVYLHTEAELAFVICHELAHYYLQHSRKRVDKMVRLINSDSLKKELKRLSKQQYRVGEELEKISKALVFDIKRHSREGEQEADRTGLQFLKKSGYSGMGFISTMKTLDRIDDTSLFMPLDLPKILSFPEYPFRERWIKKESGIFGAMHPEEASGLTKKEKDSLKTHPDCFKRIELLGDSAKAVSGSDFLVDAQMFRKLKEDFVPELLGEVFNAGNISFNLYLSLQFLQEKKHVPLAVYSVARNLNLIYQYQKEHRLGLVADTEGRYFDEGYNQLLRMLWRLRLNEIAELNHHFCSYYEAEMSGFEEFREEMEKAKANRTAHL